MVQDCRLIGHMRSNFELERNLIMIKMISPRKLYPTESLFSIEENKILFYMECFKENIVTEDIKVFLFNGNYYILKGHHKMLAANRMQMSDIAVDVVDIPANTFWSKQENISDNFRAIGMTALYDFEAVGGFVYDDYPSYYGKGE